ncbi:tetratricopeptide repeat protein [Alphaproteobacteria bacterium]|nr:tetratricopeptide repeat protein [Alphaproteobacteria bacterium]
MKRLLTTLVILSGLIGSGGAVWADAVSDFNKGVDAFDAGNFEEAVKWYRKSAEQGDASAQYALGWMYSNGKGVTQDYAEAVKWYRKAAQQGYARAQSNLGVMYRDGKGVTQDKITAHMWYNIAAANGNKRAVEGRDKVAKTLTVEQLVKANEQEERCIGNSNSTYFGKVIAYRDCDRKAKSWWKILYEIESGPDNNLLIIGLLIVFGLLPSIAILVVLIKKRDSLSWNTGSSWNFGSYKSTLSPKAFRSAHKWFFLVLFVLAVFILFLKATEEIP